MRAADQVLSIGYLKAKLWCLADLEWKLSTSTSIPFLLWRLILSDFNCLCGHSWWLHFSIPRFRAWWGLQKPRYQIEYDAYEEDLPEIRLHFNITVL